MKATVDDVECQLSGPVETVGVGELECHLQDKSSSKIEMKKTKSIGFSNDRADETRDEIEVSRMQSDITGLTSPMTFDQSIVLPSITFENHQSPSTEKKHSQKPQSSVQEKNWLFRGLLQELRKPMVASVVGLLIISMGTSVFFGKGWIQIPSLEKQIRSLSQQVNDLSSEIDRLGAQVDLLNDENMRYADLNNELEGTVDDLNNTTSRLGIIADELNSTNEELKEEVDNLTDQNSIFEAMNQDLNATVSRLSGEVELIRGTLSDLAHENESLGNLTSSLQQLVDNLENVSSDQNTTLSEMKVVIVDFQRENDRLRLWNDDLLTMISFINGTSLSLDSSFKQMTDYLTEQITVNEILVLRSLESFFRNQIASWDCDYRDIFAGENFAQDFGAEISPELEPSILEYVNDRVLSELCLDLKDFQMALKDESMGGSLTSWKLLRVVSAYTEAALDFYFPPGDADHGLGPTDWSAASFKCAHLETKFGYY